VRAASDDRYDLVVVGAGLSGLAAAYFYRKQHPDARVLILDNHDDFGGHAKRNEFNVDGRTLLGYGGSQTMQEPSGYPRVVKSMLEDIGVQLDAFDKAYDNSFFREHGLTGAVFFNEADWGASRMVKYDLNNFSDYMPMAESPVPVEEAVGRMPLSAAARAQLLRVITETRDCIAHIPKDEKRDYLDSISYRTFLERHMDVTEPEVFKVLQDLTYEMAVGMDSSPAGAALVFYALPGHAATGMPTDAALFEPYIHHFPDGNASVARLLIKHLIPHMSAATDMYELLGERFDYSRLDDPRADVRLRLSSTVVNVEHTGPAASASEVKVSYVRDGQTESVHGSNVVLACYHSIIPSLCPELPQIQREALASQVKTPILYTNVALHNWRAFKEMGVGAFVSPTAYHICTQLDFPVSLGDYAFAMSPDDPVIVHMERFPYGRGPGLSKRDRHRAGRYELLSTPFADIERSIRDQLGEALAPGGFDPNRDIAGITVNRWAHGYSYWYDDNEDEYYEDWEDPRYPHIRARQPHGRIVIANSDADANAMLEAAVEQAYRAVGELHA
jgi:spermidine dehydrogenase